MRRKVEAYGGCLSGLLNGQIFFINVDLLSMCPRESPPEARTLVAVPAV